MTSTEACAVLKIDRSTLVRWVRAGRIAPTYKYPRSNGAYLFDRVAVEALAAERRAS
ncbi:helix-turn-helix domain-containing protein [Cellulosimicrobium sp. ES-005]|uniref:Helix-turn-helix domain-containing protein n=1 Tax=Cellulosimicrobium sp. ES-005 TaxID=3163031 RepID=A0AAU8G4S3_9MICO